MPKENSHINFEIELAIILKDPNCILEKTKSNIEITKIILQLMIMPKMSNFFLAI